MAAYTWDMMNGGFPFNTMQTEMREMGIPPTYPPTSEFSRIDALRGLWEAAALTSIETTQYTIERTYENFEDLWITSSLTSSVAPKFKAMPTTEVEVLKARMRARSPADKSGRITCSARVTAVKGNAPTR